MRILIKIIFVRHGETEWNKNKKFRGQIDVKLNSRGIEQAKAVAKVLLNSKIDAIYSSPLSRATKTAKIIANDHSKDVKVVNGFIDINFGKWQGLSKNEVIEKYNKIYNDWCKNPHKVKFIDGECLDDVKKRAISALNILLQKHIDETIVIVSHRVVLKVLICALLGLDNSHFWRIKQDICAVTTFEYLDNKFILTLLNDTCHLKEIMKDRKTIDF